MIVLNGKQINKSEIRKLWDECFAEDSMCWRDWYFDNVYDPKNILCVKQEGELASMLFMNPYTLILRGAAINTFSLAGVATREKHRKCGLAGNLIKYSLQKAFKLGYSFSFLYPFKYGYYEKFGFKLSYYKYSYKKYYANQNKTSSLTVQEDLDEKQLASFYMQMCHNLNGYVLRDTGYYKTHIKELLCDNEILSFSINGNSGYYAIDKERKKTEELVFEGNINEAINELCSYYKKDIEFNNLFNIKEIVGKPQNHCMARVISVERIFSQIKMRDIKIKIKIIDSIIQENNGVWHITSENGKASAQKVDESFDYVLDISQLGPILTGIEMDEGSDERKIQKLLFIDEQPFIFEVC